jgi:hypothetical protein
VAKADAATPSGRLTDDAADPVNVSGAALDEAVANPKLTEADAGVTPLDVEEKAEEPFASANASALHGLKEREPELGVIWTLLNDKLLCATTGTALQRQSSNHPRARAVGPPQRARVFMGRTGEVKLLYYELHKIRQAALPLARKMNREV